MYGIPLKFIGIGVAALALLASLWGYGHHKYELGVTDERARWTPQLVAAQKALAEANANTKALESAAQAVTNELEATHAQTIADLNQRAADADGRIRTLSMRLASRVTACSGQLPAVPESPTEPNVPTASEERAFRIGDQLTQLARGCESDALTLEGLQQWVREQQALANVQPR